MVAWLGYMMHMQVQSFIFEIFRKIVQLEGLAIVNIA